MRWGDFRRSDNVEDRGTGGGGGAGLKLGGGAIVVVVIASLLFGVNPMEMLAMLEGGGPVAVPQQTAPAPAGSDAASRPAVRDETKEMVAHVLGDTEDAWTAVFKSMGRQYVPPKLVLFRGSTQSACGHAVAAVGPFYCPASREVYLDTAFFNDLARRFGAPGDFAQAYVIAHEVGHHVQNVLGISEQVQRIEQQDPDQATGPESLSVRLELQADCYAGVWGHFAQRRNLLDPGDVEEGLGAASAVGDDRIQKHTQGAVVPDAFTHGSSAQRARWFRIGLDSGDVKRCNTFAAGAL